MKRYEVNSQLAVANPPTLDELPEVAEAGFQTLVRIIDTRDGTQAADHERDDRRCHSLGMSVCTFTRESLQDISGVDRFRRELASHPKPVLVCSPDLETAAAFALMDHGAGAGWDADQTIAYGADLGVEVRDSALMSLVTQYIDGHIRCGAKAVARGAGDPN